MDFYKLKITADFLPVPLEHDITEEMTVGELEELLNLFNVTVDLLTLIIYNKCCGNYDDGLLYGVVEVTLTAI